VAKMALPLAFSAYVRSFLLSVEHSLIPKRLLKRGNTESEALSSYGYLHGMALPIILFPMTPLSSFSGLLVPEFAESEGADDKARMERIATEAISKTLLYAAVTSVFLYLFAEELGYVIYSSYEAGHFIAMLAPIIPIMYLDHVTDSMLKGIGEQVFSMWVNIADSFISVILVFILIPIFDINGYAIVIIVMEVFNFTLSFLRLRRRVRFGIRLFDCALIPLIIAFVSAYITLRLFPFNGAVTTPYMLTLKMVFSLCTFIALYMSYDRITSNIRKNRKNVNISY
jgi:stage V sporulation protein B